LSVARRAKKLEKEKNGYNESKTLVAVAGLGMLWICNFLCSITDKIGLSRDTVCSSEKACASRSAKIVITQHVSWK